MEAKTKVLAGSGHREEVILAYPQQPVFLPRSDTQAAEATSRPHGQFSTYPALLCSVPSPGHFLRTSSS